MKKLLSNCDRVGLISQILLMPETTILKIFTIWKIALFWTKLYFISIFLRTIFFSQMYYLFLKSTIYFLKVLLYSYFQSSKKKNNFFWTLINNFINFNYLMNSFFSQKCTSFSIFMRNWLDKNALCSQFFMYNCFFSNAVFSIPLHITNLKFTWYYFFQTWDLFFKCTIG